jgi:uncharacterized protein YrrD
MSDERVVSMEAKGLTVANPAEDVRGLTAVDRHGDEIGRVTDLLVDEATGVSRFLEVESGGFLGLTGERRLVPTDAVLRVDEHGVHLDEARERVHASLRYDPELTEQQGFWDSLRASYAAEPDWTPEP